MQISGLKGLLVSASSIYKLTAPVCTGILVHVGNMMVC